MKKTVYLLTMFLLVFVVFCNNNHDTGLEKRPQKPPVVFIGIDGSASYNFFDKAKFQVTQLLKDAPPGADYFIRWITSDSYGDTNSIVTKTFPMDLSNRQNPFNPDEIEKRDYFLMQMRKTKYEALTQVLKSVCPKSEYTDIYGFVLYVQEKIVDYRNTGRDIYMIVLSDLENNVNRYEKLVEKNSLTRVCLYFCVYQHTTPENKRKWMDIFRELGVSVFKVYGVDQEIPDIFTQTEINLSRQIKK